MDAFYYVSHCVERIETEPFNPEWISAITAVIALVLAIFEYYFRRRPYLKLDIEVIERNRSFIFLARVINLGSVPTFFSAKKEDVAIKIGDELYHAAKDIHAYVFPKDTQPPTFELGMINETGINKLLNNEYQDNSAFLEVTLTYRSNRLKWLLYRFRFKYEIILTDGSNARPRVTVAIVDQSVT